MKVCKCVCPVCQSNLNILFFDAGTLEDKVKEMKEEDTIQMLDDLCLAERSAYDCIVVLDESKNEEKDGE